MKLNSFLLTSVLLLAMLANISSSVTAYPPAPTQQPQQSPNSVPDHLPVQVNEGLTLVPEDKQGPSGTSFRYISELGEKETPYLVDTTHLNRPGGMYIDPANNDFYVLEESGARLLKYSEDKTFQFSIGKAGVRLTDNQMFNTPSDVTLAPDGHIWVADWTRIVEYDSTGNFVRNVPEMEPWATSGDDGRFNGAHGIDFDELGHLYVADQDSHRVQIFDWSEGNAPVYKTSIGVTGDSGDDLPYLNRPNRVQAKADGTLYILENGNNRVLVCPYDNDTDSWDCAELVAGLNNPQGLALSPLASNPLFILDSDNGRIIECIESTCSDFVPDTGGGLSLAVDSNGIVYVSRYYNCTIESFNPAGESQGVYLGVWDTCYLTDYEHFNSPRVEIDYQGNMLVLEENGQRLLKFDPAGAFLWSIGEAGHDAWENDHFNWPHGLDSDQYGNIYVADSWRVQVFNQDGEYVTTIGEDQPNPSFNWVTDVAVDQVTGNIYVVDNGRARVQVFNSTYRLIGQLGVTDDWGSCDVNADNAHFCGPVGVETDLAGNVYVTDWNNRRVQKFDKTRQYLMTFGTVGVGGDEHGLLNGPDDLTVDGKGQVYVADMYNARVEIFNASGQYMATIGGNWDEFHQLSDVSLDQKGNVYISDLITARIRKYAPGVPGWLQKNINGFDARLNEAISLEAFDGQLYAATANWTDGTSLFRSADGKTWTRITNFGDSINAAADVILDMIVFGSPAKLYISSGWSAHGQPGGIWRSEDGSIWENVVPDGFGNPENQNIPAMIEFNSDLYVSVSNEAGVSIYRSNSGDADSWSAVVTEGNGDPDNVDINHFVVFNGSLYCVGRNRTLGAFVWKASPDGNTWTTVNDLGFGEPMQQEAISAAVFQDALYVGTKSEKSDSSATGYIGSAQIWRTSNGTSWENVIDAGFGDGNNTILWSLWVFANQLYAIAENPITGAELWKTSDGVNWIQAAPDGFGNYTSHWTLPNNVHAEFQNNLYISLANPTLGGQVWQMMNYIYLPMMLR
jgi:sugar lactone lactonase YvrE